MASASASSTTPRVLMIGDSLSVNTLSGQIVSKLAGGAFGHLRILASGGSKPTDWTAGTPVYVNTWGYSDYTESSRISVGRPEILRSPFNSPKLVDLLQKETPDIVVIQQGTNLLWDFDLSEEKSARIKREVSELVSQLWASPNAPAKCLWLTPPDTSKFSPEAEDKMYHLINEAVSGRCKVFDSRTVGAYPTAPGQWGGDGVHHSGARGGAELQQKWSNAISLEINQLARDIVELPRPLPAFALPSTHASVAPAAGIGPNVRSLKPLTFLKGQYCQEALDTPRENLLVVLNWNILKEYQSDGKNRHPQILKVIADLDPDFIGLQEVYGRPGQESAPDVKNDFALPLKQMGLSYWYSNDDEILVRNPDPSKAFYADTQHPNRPVPFARIGGFSVTISHPDVPQIRFYSVHLSAKQEGFEILDEVYQSGRAITAADIEFALHNPGAKDRTENLRVLSNSILALEKKESTPMPTILVGDFNSTSHLDWTRHNPYLMERYPFLNDMEFMPWEESKMISYDFFDTYRALHPSNKPLHWGATWTPMWNGLPSDRIDYNYFRNPSKQAIQPICSYVIGESNELADLYLDKSETWPSDHRALLTIYKLGK